MKGIFYKSLIFIFARYLFSWIVMYVIDKDAKFVQLSDFRNAEDWFYFFWLFGIPFVIDFITLGLPIMYVVYKSKSYVGKLKLIIALIALIAVDFFLSKSIYGLDYAIMKSIIGLILLPVFFRHELFYNVEKL